MSHNYRRDEGNPGRNLQLVFNTFVATDESLGMHGSGSGYGIRAPHPEGRLYDAVGYERVVTTRWIVYGLAYTGILGVFYLGVMSDSLKEHNASLLLLASIFMLFTSAPYAIYYYVLLNKHEVAVAAEKQTISTGFAADLSFAKSKALETTELLEAQMKELEKIKSAQRTGDVIIHGNRAPVFISSEVVNSFNTIAPNDPELATAIKIISGYIEQAGNKDAACYFNEFHEKIASGEKNKTVLKALWLGVTAALPEIATLTDVVSKIKELFD